MNHKAWLLGGCLLLVVFYYVRLHHVRYDRLEAARIAAGETQREQLKVAVVWPYNAQVADSLLLGVHLATEQINGADGVTLEDKKGNGYAAKIKLVHFDESPTNGIAIARRIAQDESIVAVIGHRPETAIPASIIYNASGVLFLAPGSSDPSLTLHGFPYVFSIAADDQQVAEALVHGARYIVDDKATRVDVGILYPDSLFKPSGTIEASGEGTTADLAADGDHTPDPIKRRLAAQLAAKANAILETSGNQTVFSVSETNVRSYSPALVDYANALDSMVESISQNLVNVVLIMDVAPNSLRLKEKLEDRLTDAGIDSTAVPIVDLNGLDWSQGQDLYTEFAADEDFMFGQAARLSLGAVKKKVAVLTTHDGAQLGAKIWASVYDSMGDPANQLSLELYRSYRPQAESYMPLIAEMSQKEIDYIYLAGVGSSEHGQAAGLRLIQQIRQSGMSQRIVCGPRFETPFLLDRLIIRKANPYLEQLVESAKQEFPFGQQIQDGKSAENELRQMITTRVALFGFDKTVSSVLSEQQIEAINKGIRELTDRSLAACYQELEPKLTYLDSQRHFRDILDRWYYSGKTLVASAFNSVDPSNPRTREFVAAIQEGRADTMAAAGFLSVWLVHDAFERARSASPKAAAGALLLDVREHGVLGRTYFSPQGDLQGLEIVLKETRTDSGEIRVIRTGPDENQRLERRDWELSMRGE